MFDSRYFAYCSITALLVMSPGATMAVVLKAAVEEGRSAALFTVLGVNVGNSTLALASAFGMAILFAKWPLALHVVKIGGAVYLTYLGVMGLGHAWLLGARTSTAGAAARAGRSRGVAPEDARLGGPTAPPQPAKGHRSVARRASVVRGILTNLLNPPVVLFYMTFLPQFIGPGDPFLQRFLVLAATHVSMSLVWLSIYAVSLGTLGDRMTRPAVRRAMETATGVVLIGFGVRLFFR
jgi:threonine/homoserine/homoserine lactone efflux protein